MSDNLANIVLARNVNGSPVITADMVEGIDQGTTSKKKGKVSRGVVSGTETRSSVKVVVSTLGPDLDAEGAVMMPPTAMPPTSMLLTVMPPTAMPLTSMPPTAMPPTAMLRTAMPPTVMPPTVMQSTPDTSTLEYAPSSPHTAVSNLLMPLPQTFDFSSNGDDTQIFWDWNFKDMADTLKLPLNHNNNNNVQMS